MIMVVTLVLVVTVAVTIVRHAGQEATDLPCKMDFCGRAFRSATIRNVVTTTVRCHTFQ